MLLETLINPKPKTTVYFAVISFLFLAIPSLEVSLIDSYSDFSYPYLIFFSSIFILLLHAFGLNNLIYNNNIIKKENLIIATVFISLNTSAFSTYGGERVSRKSYPSYNESLSKDLYLAVGILCLCINSLANFLLPYDLL